MYLFDYFFKELFCRYCGEKKSENVWLVEFDQVKIKDNVRVTRISSQILIFWSCAIFLCNIKKYAKINIWRKNFLLLVDYTRGSYGEWTGRKVVLPTNIQKGPSIRSILGEYSFLFVNCISSLEFQISKLFESQDGTCHLEVEITKENCALQIRKIMYWYKQDKNYF